MLVVKAPSSTSVVSAPLSITDTLIAFPSAPTSFAAQWNGLAVADRYVASYTSLVVIERR